jgi:hypothetical protein
LLVGLRLEVVIRFFYIGGMVDYHCLNVLFIMKIRNDTNSLNRYKTMNEVYSRNASCALNLISTFLL